MFSKSVKEIKNVKVMVLCGLLVALAVAIEIVNPLNASTSLKISFSFIFLALIGYFGGPVTSMYVAFVFDILNFMFSKDGAVFVPWYTILEIAGGFIYGVILYRYAPKWNKNPIIDTVLKCAVCKTLINVIINIVGNSTLNIWLYNVAKNGIVAYMIPRIVKNLMLLPAEIAVLVIIITFIRKERQFSVWLNK